MKTFVKILVAQNSGGAGGGGCCSPPAPTARTLLGAITCFFQLNNGVIIMEWIQ